MAKVTLTRQLDIYTSATETCGHVAVADKNVVDQAVSGKNCLKHGRKPRRNNAQNIFRFKAL